ncbi:hypothetical protein O6H91_22G030200 [Diphasiastrum complanatum]|uniref:Uncharacterized protein n=1 Tax=Diphasiastrum complanatum TaxID=34168 RepID=A0ACC2AE53_DIPCM|nr:hypothetical protein O6H91_22G030200 [Diphasiastrum complanatum]
MGLKPAIRQSTTSLDAAKLSPACVDPTSGLSSTIADASGRPSEKQNLSRRKGMEKSILDDIMGDPDDFTDLADPDAGSEDDGGRWEDTVRETLENEKALKVARVSGIEDDLQMACEHIEPTIINVSFDVTQSVDSSLPNTLENPGSIIQTGKGRRAKVDEKEWKRFLSVGQTDNSSLKPHKVHDTRYFIIKSLNQHNISKSVEKGIWATQAMNEPVLNEAFETSERVILIFSINMSGHFQGYAQMSSPIGRRRANVWSEANEGANPWGGTFSVNWLRLYDLPFQRTVHLKNPLNHFKPVKISRDCQELAQDVGEALCSLIDEGAEREEKLKWKVGPGTGLGSKRSREEPFDLLPENSFVPPIAGSTLNSPMPSVIYSGQQVNSETAHKPYTSQRLFNRPLGGLSSRTSGHIEQSRGSKSRSPQKSSEHERERDRQWHKDQDKAVNIAGQEDRSGMNCRSSNFPPEEDLLNMTYEEYLQRHGRARSYSGNQQPGGPTASFPAGPTYGGGWMGDNSGAAYQDDQYSAYLANWYSRQGPLVQGDGFYGAHGMLGAYPTVSSSDQHWHSKNNGIHSFQNAEGWVSAGARDHNGHSY